MRRGRFVGIALAMLALAGCAKKEEPVAAAPVPAPASKTEAPRPEGVELVQEKERSRHFKVVNAELELGGTLYGYVDVDGDAQKLAHSLQGAIGGMAESEPKLAPYLKQDFPALFSILGFDDLKAFGLSSVPDGTGFFRNRAFFYMPDGRHGLFSVLGGPAAPSRYVKLAPKDADFFGEGETDLAAVYATVRQVVEKAAGPDAAKAMEAALANTSNPVGFSSLDLIKSFKGRDAVVLRLDASKTMTIPAGPVPLKIPTVSLLLCFDGIGSVVDRSLAKVPMLAVRTEGQRKIYSLKQPVPLEGVDPVLAIEGDTFYISTSAAFFNECTSQTSGLAQAEAYRTALAHVGAEGNSLVYVAPSFFERLRQLGPMNPGLDEKTRRTIDLVAANLPKIDRPLVAVRINRPDGILVKSYWDRSSKQDVAMLAVYNPLTVGFLAAMAIPAFQKVRTASQQKVVLNNLRQLSAAADQYYLENNVTTATFDDLVGPDKYVRRLNPVAGENYRELQFKQGEPLRIHLSSGEVVQYPLESQ
jgi:type IV pilus assembly protein PilA